MITEAVKSLAKASAAFGLAQTSVGRAFLGERVAEERGEVERRRAQDRGFCFDHGHELPCPFCAAEEV